jgi:hypothetical protein
MSPKTAKHMIWHQSHNTVDGVMVHHSDGEAWKHFNNMHFHFSVESKSVHFRLSMICCSLFLLAGCTNGLQLATEGVYEVGVHVFIYGHTQS